ncbi:hypothetical protein KAR91_57470 [Candidatus Pacearchaeota archaeon]|nr:hypothetical protein [Candidatus Pacearchaeota archaeon]
MAKDETIVDIVKKNVAGTKHTDDYILGYLDAIAEMSHAVSVVQSKFTLESYQTRCVEWNKKGNS